MEQKLVAPGDIKLDERGRKDYGPIDELVEDIKELELIHPIAVERRADGLYLLAGGRRLKACKQAKMKEIPVRIYEELPPFKRKKIELHENLKRLDLSPQEEIKMKSELHDLYVSQYGEKRGPRSLSGHSIQDTAKLLGEDAHNLGQELKVARVLEEKPELFEKCKTKSEMHRIVGSEIEAVILLELTRRAAENATVQNKKGETLGDKIMQNYRIGDTFDIMAKLGENTFDFIEIDPPYGVDFDNRGHVGHEAQKARGKITDVGKKEYPDFIRRVMKESYRLMKPSGWGICWYSMEYWHAETLAAIREAGFKCPGMPALWIKTVAQNQDARYRMTYHYEPFFYFRKSSDSFLAHPSHTSNFVVSSQANNVHPNQKPLALMQKILKTFCLPNSLILIPFCGSGNTLIAGNTIDQCEAIGIDMEERYRDLLREFLERKGFFDE